MLLFRWIIGLPAAALVTAGLFFMMAELIKEKDVDLPSARETPDLRVTAEEPDKRPTITKPPRPVPADQQPETIIDNSQKSERPGTGDFFPDPTAVNVDPGDGTMPITAPAVRITPAYPERCRSKGAHGVVTVQFDVTPEGNVTNPRIIESPDRCFDRPIRNAVSKWKYPPASSRLGMRYGMVETFSFQLVD